MAFSLQVQPQSGQNIGQGILMAAQGIAAGMNKYYQRKEENEQVAKAADMFAGAAQQNPFLAQALGIADVKDTAAIKNAIKGAGGPGKFLQVAQGVHSMTLAAQEADRQAKMVAIQQAEEARRQAAEARQQALYSQGQAQVQDMRMVNQVAQGGGSPMNNQAYGQAQQRLRANPMLRPVAAAVAATGQPMTNKEYIDMQQNATPFQPEVITLADGTKVVRTSRNSVQTMNGDFAPGQPMMDRAGNYIGTTSFDKQANKLWLLGPNGKKTEVPEGASPVTATGLSKSIPQADSFRKWSEDVTSAEISLGNMDRYMKSVGDSNVGLQRLADGFTAGWKTLFSTKDKKIALSPEELANAMAKGQVQGLLGANRTNVVGGGVMTEQDAIRVLMRLGGDVGALQNPELVKAAIAQVYADRYKQYQNDLTFYNTGVEQYYGSKGFKAKEPLTFNPVFATALQAMGDPAAPGATVGGTMGGKSLINMTDAELDARERALRAGK